MTLKKEFEKLLTNKKYFIPIRRKKNISYKNYHNKPVDPDGKKRNLIAEREKKIKHFKIIINFLKKQKKRNILDVGCGFGWMLSELKSKEWNKFGIEISEVAKNQAIKNNIKIFDNLKSIKKIKFDIISMIHVIEHIYEPVKYFKMLKKNLKKNGILIIETPDFDCAMARKYDKKFRLLHDKTHVSLFSLDSLCRMLRDNNFEIFKMEFPFFEGEYFNKKNLLRLFSKEKNFSPPFYGSVMTIFAKKIK